MDLLGKIKKGIAKRPRAAINPENRTEMMNPEKKGMMTPAAVENRAEMMNPEKMGMMATGQKALASRRRTRARGFASLFKL